MRRSQILQDVEPRLPPANRVRKVGCRVRGSNHPAGIRQCELLRFGQLFVVLQPEERLQPRQRFLVELLQDFVAERSDLLQLLFVQTFLQIAEQLLGAFEFLRSLGDLSLKLPHVAEDVCSDVLRWKSSERSPNSRC